MDSRYCGALQLTVAEMREAGDRTVAMFVRRLTIARSRLHRP